jgi:hypothetical protein
MGPEGGMEEWEGEGRRSWRSTSELLPWLSPVLSKAVLSPLEPRTGAEDGR